MFGCISREPSIQDFNYNAMTSSINTASVLPRKFRVDMIGFDNQGTVGKCVGEAFQAAVESQMIAEGEEIKLSSRYHYEKCKLVDNIKSEGTTNVQGAKTLVNNGICTEALYPFDPFDSELSSDMKNLIFEDIPKNCDIDAEKRKYEGYAIVSGTSTRDFTVGEITRMIVEENGVIAGFCCTDTFMNPQNGVIGFLQGRGYGNHAVFMCGYDLDEVVTFDYGKFYPSGKVVEYKGYIEFKHSWINSDGTPFGDNGIGKLPLELINYKMIDFPLRLLSEIVVPIRGNKAGYNFDKDYHLKYNEERLEAMEDKIVLTIDSTTAIVNNKEVQMDVAPTIINDRTMIPLRFVSEEFDSEVLWDGDKRQVTIKNGNSIVILTIDSNIAIINGNEYEMDVAPTIINDRTMIPVRYIIDFIGGEVLWDGDKRQVTIIR